MYGPLIEHLIAHFIEMPYFGPIKCSIKCAIKEWENPCAQTNSSPALPLGAARKNCAVALRSGNWRA
jgi:hypothetical protein